jgi:hypothetical protein
MLAWIKSLDLESWEIVLLASLRFIGLPPEPPVSFELISMLSSNLFMAMIPEPPKLPDFETIEGSKGRMPIRFLRSLLPSLRLSTEV